MKYPENIQQIALLQPHMLGMIFYPKSPRYVDTPTVLSTLMIPSSVKRIGVFVDEKMEIIMQKVKMYNLHGVQLHGDESPELCLALKQESLTVIKAFSVASAVDFERCTLYEHFVDYLLFDTKTAIPGGSGQQFDWQITVNYKGLTPFFLSGGITPDDADALLALQHKRFVGIDLNSGFETAPGLKDKELLQPFMQKISVK